MTFAKIPRREIINVVLREVPSMYKSHAEVMRRSQWPTYSGDVKADVSLASHFVDIFCWDAKGP